MSTTALIDAPGGTVPGRFSARNLASSDGTRIGDEMTTQRPFFRVRDIARMWGEERARAAGRDVATAEPVAEETVYSYLKHSQPPKPGRKSRRYAENPMPLPTYLNDDGDPVDPQRGRRGQQPIWLPAEGQTLEELEHELRGWWHSRPGPGVGGGRPPKQRAEQVPCPCGCGELVAPGTMCDRSAAERAGAQR